MKKLFYLIFSALFILVSCGKEEPDYAITGIWKNVDEEFYYLRIDAMESEGYFELGWYQKREDAESRTNREERGFLKEVERHDCSHKLEYCEASLVPMGQYCWIYADKETMQFKNESSDRSSGFVRIQ